MFKPRENLETRLTWHSGDPAVTPMAARDRHFGTIIQLQLEAEISTINFAKYKGVPQASPLNAKTLNPI